jgi:hypothetical protein
MRGSRQKDHRLGVGQDADADNSDDPLPNRILCILKGVSKNGSDFEAEWRGLGRQFWPFFLMAVS